MVANELPEPNAGIIPVNLLYQELALNIDEIDPEQKYLRKYELAFVALKTLDFNQGEFVSDYNNMLLSTIGLADEVEIYVDPNVPDRTLHLSSGQSCNLEPYSGEKLKIITDMTWEDWPLESWLYAPGPYTEYRNHNCLLILSPGQSGGFALELINRCNYIETLHMYVDDISANFRQSEALVKNLFWPLNITTGMIESVASKDKYIQDYYEFLVKRKTETSQSTQKNHIERLLNTTCRMNMEINAYLNKLLYDPKLKLYDRESPENHIMSRFVKFIHNRSNS